ncbi:MAG: SDR family NAD(P)-dependent oxidoreductase [Phycicoccus sp.]
MHEELAGRFAVVTGGTDGIGAATARQLAARGAQVVAIGRSEEKARALQDQVHGSRPAGSLRVLARDLSLMRTVEEVVAELASEGRSIDLLVHAVGVLSTRTSSTVEGVERGLAVSYLSRFAFLEDAARHGLLHERTRMVNIAASAPTVPRHARMEFRSVAEVEARTGMRGHGQSQLANDLLTAGAPRRHGITAVGYGPGAVDTSIRRDVPRPVRALMSPFFARRTRTASAAAADVVAALTDPAVAVGSASFRNRDGAFAAAEFVVDAARQDQLLAVSEVLLDRARTQRAGRHPHRR